MYWWCTIKAEKNYLKEHKIELIVIALFIIAVFIRVNINGVFDYPGNIKAADAFYHTIAADKIVDEEAYGNLPYYLAIGYKDMIDPSPPLGYLIVAPIVKISRIPVWNVMYLMICVYEAMAIIILYLITSKIFNKYIGLIAASLYLFPLALSKWLYPMYIGLWAMMCGFIFFFAGLWLVYEYYQKPERWKIFCLGAIVAAMWLAHIAEVFLLGFFLLMVAIRLLMIKNIKETIIQAVYFAILPIISFILYLPRFNELRGFTTGMTEGGIIAFNPLSKLQELPFYTSLRNFPVIILILLIAGAVLVLLNWKKYKKFLVAESYLFFYLFLFPFFFSAFYFFIRQRGISPFIVYPIVAYALYFLVIKNITKYVKLDKLVLIAVIALIAIGFAIPQYINLRKGIEGKHLTREKYDALLWIQKNTLPNEEIFFLTGYYQYSSMYSKRVGFFLDTPKLQEVLQSFYQSNGTDIPLLYRTEPHGLTEMNNFAYKKTFFEYGYYELGDQLQNILDFDYVVMQNMADVVVSFNQAAGSFLMSRNYTVVYDRGGVAILKKT